MEGRRSEQRQEDLQGPRGRAEGWGTREEVTNHENT